MKNLSPIYNPNWEADGDLFNCFNYLKDYITSLALKNIENLQIFEESGVTPALFFTAPIRIYKKNTLFFLLVISIKYLLVQAGQDVLLKIQ